MVGRAFHRARKHLGGIQRAAYARITAPVVGLHQAAYLLAGLTLASQKEDMDAIIAISDRMLAIFQYVNEAEPHKVKMGFNLAHRDIEDEEHDD